MSNRSIYSDRDDLDNQEGLVGHKMLDMEPILGPLHSGRGNNGKKVFI